MKMLEEWNLKLAKATAMQSAPVQAAAKQYNELTHRIDRATRATKLFSESAAGTNQITAGFRAALAGVGMGFGIYTSGTIVAASATYSVVAAFREVISVGAEFQKEMARVNAAMNLTAEQYDDLSARAVKMASTSRYATNEIVRAYREMAMSGFTYQETVDGIDAVMAMASIGMMEFGEAADIATNVLFGFNLNAKDLTDVVDILAKTITNSAQDLRQLGNTMSYVAPVASSYGISLQTVAAATEVLANAGLKSSRSGTGLRRTFTALFSDSENVAGVLAEMGVTVNTLAADMDQEFLRVLKALNVATNGATTNVGKLTDAVGLYAIPTFLNLVKAADSGVTSLGFTTTAFPNSSAGSTCTWHKWMGKLNGPNTATTPWG
jgi:TP901 family phage tail tape measure protein